MLAEEGQQGKGSRVLKLIQSKSPKPLVVPSELGTASGWPLSPEEGPGRRGGGSWRAAKVMAISLEQDL